jgi:hypothetical protein
VILNVVCVGWTFKGVGSNFHVPFVALGML